MKNELKGIAERYDLSVTLVEKIDRFVNDAKDELIDPFEPPMLFCNENRGYVRINVIRNIAELLSNMIKENKDLLGI